MCFAGAAVLSHSEAAAVSKWSPEDHPDSQLTSSALSAPRGPRGGNWMARCQVLECRRALEPTDPAYFKKFRICPRCSCLKQLEVEGQVMRFCQQCGRFQDLGDFDGDRKSCRSSLAKHNERRARRKEAKKRKAAGLPHLPAEHAADLGYDGSSATFLHLPTGSTRAPRRRRSPRGGGAGGGAALDLPLDPQLPPLPSGPLSAAALEQWLQRFEAAGERREGGGLALPADAPFSFPTPQPWGGQLAQQAQHQRRPQQQQQLQQQLLLPPPSHSTELQSLLEQLEQDLVWQSAQPAAFPLPPASPAAAAAWQAAPAPAAAAAAAGAGVGSPGGSLLGQPADSERTLSCPPAASGSSQGWQPWLYQGSAPMRSPPSPPRRDAGPPLKELPFPPFPAPMSPRHVPQLPWPRAGGPPGAGGATAAGAGAMGCQPLPLGRQQQQQPAASVEPTSCCEPLSGAAASEPACPPLSFHPSLPPSGTLTGPLPAPPLPPAGEWVPVSAAPAVPAAQRGPGPEAAADERLEALSLHLFKVPTSGLAPHVKEGLLKLMAADPVFVGRLLVSP